MQEDFETNYRIEKLCNGYTIELIERKKNIKTYNVNIINVTKEDLINLEFNARNFFSSNFPGLNTKILHSDYDYFLKKKDMFDVNISLSSIPCESYITTDTITDEYYREISFFIGDVVLPKKSFANILPLYVHELTHFLTMRNQNTFASVLDQEMLSIFIEKLNIKEDSKEYYLNELIRWKALTLRKGENTINSFIYFNSFIKANYLYFLYRNMNNVEKINLFENIKLVFHDNMTIDEFCCIYNIDINEKEIYDVSLCSINDVEKTFNLQKKK